MIMMPESLKIKTTRRRSRPQTSQRHDSSNVKVHGQDIHPLLQFQSAIGNRRTLSLLKGQAPAFSRLPSGLYGLCGYGHASQDTGYLQRDRRGERRTRREVESDRRRRRPEGGRGRGRRAGGDFESDWAGRAILLRYLNGEGDWTIRNDPNWSRYMMANWSLREVLRPKVREIARNAFGRPRSTEETLDFVDEQFPVTIENGEGIIGYQYLHGTNRNAGDFQINGTTIRTSTLDGVTVTLDLSYTWNDIIDPNPRYWTDRLKSAFAELITLGRAEGYEIHITWNARAEVRFDSTGAIVSTSGWPFA